MFQYIIGSVLGRFAILILFIMLVLSVLRLIKSREKKYKKKVIIYTVIFIATVYIFYFAGAYMPPKFEESTIDEAMNILISEYDGEYYEKTVKTDYCTIKIGLEEESTNEVDFTNMKNDVQVFGKQGINGETEYVFRTVKGSRGDAFYDAGGTYGFGFLKKDNYYVKILYYYEDNSLLEKLFSSLTVPQFFFRWEMEKIDLLELVKMEGKTTDTGFGYLITEGW